MIEVYSAEWCTPCKQLKKLLDSNDIEYTVIDIDERPEASKAKGIRGIPTIIHKDRRLVGAVTLEQVKDIL